MKEMQGRSMARTESEGEMGGHTEVRVWGLSFFHFGPPEDREGGLRLAAGRIAGGKEQREGERRGSAAFHFSTSPSLCLSLLKAPNRLAALPLAVEGARPTAR